MFNPIGIIAAGGGHKRLAGGDGKPGKSSADRGGEIAGKKIGGAMAPPTGSLALAQITVTFSA